MILSLYFPGSSVKKDTLDETSFVGVGLEVVPDRTASEAGPFSQRFQYDYNEAPQWQMKLALSSDASHEDEVSRIVGLGRAMLVALCASLGAGLNVEMRKIALITQVPLQITYP